MAALEVKSSEHVTSTDFNGIRVLAEAVGEDFAAGIGVPQALTPPRLSPE